MEICKCETCRWHHYGVNDEHGRGEAVHQCRFNAPAHFSGSGMGYDAHLFPEVQPDMWCREFAVKGKPDVFHPETYDRKL